ncbi:hypothetical protein [Gracilibacillus salinarum]|uniref:Uncharacterized protein n=1 Tax=Gracilibacillus salinarum TaxID=2932255 RepID=A0ABY4GLA9_9BACI|nr:hypothetical protein [Gracilibacillus salinarum]UOQ85136.1 hypothetical protein MUN87_21235 [Gracilibacillus salinarum]
MKKLWETLRTMSFKEAVDYIWEYYKIHIFGIVLGIAFLVSILTTIFQEEEETYELMVLSQIPYDVTDQFSQDLNEKYFDGFNIVSDNILSNGGSLSEQSPEQVQKLMARIATGMVDIMVTDETMAQEMADQDGLVNFEEVADMEALEAQGVEFYQFGKGEVLGIGTNQFDVFNDNEAFQDRILIIPASTEKKERTKQILETLLES